MGNGKKFRNKVAILNVLRHAQSMLHSAVIAEELLRNGFDLSERSVRLYLQDMEREGLTVPDGRKGHRITERGLAELGGATVVQRVGYMAAHLDAKTYEMSFDLATRTGSVVVNCSVVAKELLRKHIHDFTQVFTKGYAMGTQVGLLKPGERLPGLSEPIPVGHWGICTVSSVTLNGILLRHGIPVRNLSGGLMDLAEGRPRQVSELIAYDSTSVDPLYLFIQAGMTDYLGAIRTGNGRIGIGYKEVPSESYDLVCSLAERVRSVGLGAFLEIGKPNQALFNMPVRHGSCGIVVIGGLNPVAVFIESGHRVRSFPVSAVMEYHRLFHYSELQRKVDL